MSGEIINLNDEPAVKHLSGGRYKSLEEGKLAVVNMTSAQLKQLEATLVSDISSDKEADWSRELLTCVQSTLLSIKKKSLAPPVKPMDAITVPSVRGLNAQITRGNAAKTLVLFKRLTGEFPETLLANPKLNFALKTPLTQIAAKSSSCMFAILPGEPGEALMNHIEYFKSRQRAGIAHLGTIQVAFVPPGPLARTFIGTELLMSDTALEKLAIGLILN